jgi:hypothetical protein
VESIEHPAPQPLPPISAQTPEPSSSTPSPAYDAEYVRQLEYQAQQQREVLDRLSPYADKINYLLENPHAADLFDVTKRAYEEEQQRRKPQVPEEFAPVIEALNAKVEPLVSYVEQERRAKESQEKASQAAFYKESADYASRLVGEKKITREQIPPA